MKYAPKLTHNFYRKTNEDQHQLLNNITDLHLITSDYNYQKFLVICNIRTGQQSLVSFILAILVINGHGNFS